MAEDSGRAERSAAWGIVAVVFGAGALGTGITAATARSAFVPWGIAAILLGLATAIGIYMTFAPLYGWPTLDIRRLYYLKRPDSKTDDRPVRGGQGLEALLAAMPPLSLRLEDEEWELWREVIWIALLKVRLTNGSLDNRVIRLRQFSLESDPGSGERPALTQAQGKAVLDEILRRRDALSPHLRTIDLLASDSVSGWYVDLAALPADGGRPRCKFVVTDAVGDRYELVIPARSRQVYRMPGSEVES
jgi:hypothetical protein